MKEKCIFYKTEKVSFAAPLPEGTRITAIRSLTGEIMYLIEGQERAVLMDTCLGVGNLKAVVSGLTEKPLTVLLTHGHIDHAMGAADFDPDQVYMNHRDLPVYEAMKDVEGRKGYIAGNLGIRDGDAFPFEDSEFTVQPETFLPRELQDGMCFDLGGLHVETYALPGHTPGSMILLIPEARLLITGDACNKSTFVFDEISLPLVKYRDNLLAMSERLAGRYDRVFICHHDMEMPADILERVAEVCTEVLSGISDEIPFPFMGKTYLLAKKTDQQMNRLDGGVGNIIYDKNKL